MEFVTPPHSHRYALEIIQSNARPEWSGLWHELTAVIAGIGDEDLVERYEARDRMSLSAAINELLRERLVERGWSAESPIFQDDGYSDKRWRLDFAKDRMAVEVAFNHGEAIAWNLIKPVLASELNHVRKAIQTEVGVLVTATAALKEHGAFDSAVGEYEKVLRYLVPFRNILTVPMVIVGLLPPRSFCLEKVKRKDGRHGGRVVRFPDGLSASS